ncbi:MAG: DUF1467 family protein [Pseudomonadota bacterium]
MEFVFAIAVYFVVWWIGLFAVLPFFAQPQNESETGEIVPGTPESAPVAFPLGRLVVVNSLVAACVFAVLWSVIVFDPFGLGQVPDVIPN